MPITPAATTTFHAPPVDGGPGGEAEIFHFTEFDTGHNVIDPASPLTANSNQSALVHAIVSGTSVDVQCVAFNPAISSCNVTVTDGRGKQAVIQVALAGRNDLSSLEVTGRDGVRTL